MNIAILIGVSNYDKASDLPACFNDVNILNKIISHGDKYQSKLFIDSGTNSSLVKSKMSEFIRKHEGTEIDELFFYFSGHGLFSDDEFYYAFSDYDPKKIKNTTYENTEIDSLIKSLAPKLAVKVVDACNAGVSYIKNTDFYTKTLQEKSTGFENCYFMLSSNTLQSSFADNKLSYFTKSFIESIAYSQTDSIRFKSVIDYISDAFSDNKDQTPLFINQAKYTEVFINSDNNLRDELSAELRGLAQTQLENTPRTSLLERIKEDEKRYFKQDSAMKIYDNVRDYLIQKGTFIGEGKEVFDLSVNVIDDYKIAPKFELLAEIVHSNREVFFANCVRIKKTRKKKILKEGARGMTSLGLASFGRSIFTEDDFEVIDESYMVNADINPTIEIPYKGIEFKASSHFENVNSASLYIFPFISRTHIMICNYLVHSICVGWDGEKAIQGDFVWSSVTVELVKNESLTHALDNIWSEFEAFALKPIKNELGITNEEQLESDSSATIDD